MSGIIHEDYCGYPDDCNCVKVAAHTRTSTDCGPDFCQECSEAIQDWVKWPCEGAKVAHGPDVCSATICAVCWAPGGLGLNEQGSCRGRCAYGTCGGQPNPCGGCCGCLGGCVVQYENRQPPAN